MLTNFVSILPHLFPIVGFLFSVVFITIMCIILVKALSKTDIGDLFKTTDNAGGGISITKFWQNVAYAASTVAFLVVNIAGNTNGSNLEILWVIYLGTVASNAVLSKWITLKYERRSGSQERGEDGYSRRTDYSRRGDPYRDRGRSEGAQRRRPDFEKPGTSEVADPDAPQN